jgi:hypothetical protein
MAVAVKFIVMADTETAAFVTAGFVTAGFVTAAHADLTKSITAMAGVTGTHAATARGNGSVSVTAGA